MSNRRRSQRTRVNLDVEYRVGRRTERLRSADVSLHGLAIFTDIALPLKQFVEMELILPQDFAAGNQRVQVTAQVIRVVDDLKDKSGLSHSGVCFDLHSFASSGHALWRRYLTSLIGRMEPVTRSQTPQPSTPDDELIAFVVRPPDIPRMWAFYEFELGRGRSKVESPQRVDDLTSVELVLVHPKTEAEWIFTGTVLSDSGKNASGSVILEVGLNDVSAQDKDAFKEFIRTGRAQNISSSGQEIEQEEDETPTPLMKPPKRRPTFASFFDEFASQEKKDSSDGEPT